MRLRQQWKLFPVTWSVVVASTALFIATRVTWLQQAYPRLWADAVLAGSDWFGWWKDLAPLAEFVRSTVPEADIIAIMEDAGALGLEAFWQGDAWRLLVSGFHHGFFLHIAGNLLVLAALGQLMEPRCRRRWWYLAFCLSSTLVTVLAEALLGQAAIGLSGTGYAMFGYLSIVRMRDQKLREILPLGLVIVGVVSMLVCIPITHFGWLPIANTAHFVGLGYGMLAGAVATAPRPILAGSGFLAAHLALIPLTQMAMEPTWTDFYIECQAYHEEDPADKARLLTELLRRDPTRDDVRLRLVWALVTGKQQDVAWRVAVAGWHDKPDSDQKALVALLQHLWFRLDEPADRERYETVMDELLGNQADLAKRRLDLAWLSVQSNIYGPVDEDPGSGWFTGFPRPPGLQSGDRSPDEPAASPVKGTADDDDAVLGQGA